MQPPTDPVGVAESMGMETDTMHDLTALAAAAGLATPSRDGVPAATREEPGPSESSRGDGGLTMVFSLPDGSDQSIAFGKRQPPLGMDFSTKVPVNVKRVKPDGHAADLGVREEWVIKSINGESVHGWEPKEIFAKLSKVVMGEANASPSTPATSGIAGASPSPGFSPITAMPNGGYGNFGMILGFRSLEGLVVQVNFADRRPPLGMDFERAAPVRVKRVIPNGHAEDLGVKAGWTVTSVNGEDVEAMEFNDVFARMRVASSSRPEMPKTIQMAPPG